MAYLRYLERYPLSSLAVFIIAIPLALCMYRYRYLDKAFRLLFIFLILDFVVGLMMFHLAAYRTNNVWLLNGYVLFRYSLTSGMFYFYYQSVRLKQAVLASIVAFVCISLLDIYLSNENLTDWHNHLSGKYSQVIESILIIFWVLAYFYELIKHLNIQNIVGYPFFWVCAGVLIFYSTNVFYAPFMYYINRWENDLKLGFMEKIPYMFEIVSLILFSVGIWLTRSHYDIAES
jgi:hypothetical protein